MTFSWTSMDTLSTVRLTSESWISGTEELNRCLRDGTTLKQEYLLQFDDTFSDSRSRDTPRELIEYFQIPPYLLADIYRRSNGFFAFKESRNQNGEVDSSYMWFRMMAKIAENKGGMKYHWDNWLQSQLEQILGQMWPDVQGPHPGSLLVPLMEVIVAMYDRSIWSIRDLVRGAEKDRERAKHDTKHFELLHEAARHAIHSSETLSVAIETLSSIQKHLAGWSNQQSVQSQGLRDPSEFVNRHLEFQVRTLRNLHLRAESNKERLQNEIALAYNMIAQRDSQVMTKLGEAARDDSQVMKKLGEAAKEDSGAMRTIAVVSMFFLPPTFISAVFSMSFFNYTPPGDGQPGKWSVSERFWVYWVIAIPLTALTLGVWMLRQRLQRKSASSRDVSYELSSIGPQHIM